MGVDAFPDNLSLVLNSSNAFVDFGDRLKTRLSAMLDNFNSQLKMFFSKMNSFVVRKIQDHWLARNLL